MPQEKEKAKENLLRLEKGPSRSFQVVRPEIFHLEDLNGKKEPHAWNVQYLKRYYV